MRTSLDTLLTRLKIAVWNLDSLVYLTASRPDLVFAVCMCARYQSKPTKKHLKAVKRVFRYLQGTINMGLCTPGLNTSTSNNISSENKWKREWLSCIREDRVSMDDNMANEHVPSPATTRSDDQILLFNAWVSIGKALTASADAPSSFTTTTETTSTLPPPPPPLQQSTVHRDIR
ncbi:hypothetical protein Tco_0504644 [Tanacetum coccineum]